MDSSGSGVCVLPRGILGLWRAGERYNETTLKLGAIFAIIPILSIVAPVLVIVGFHEARGRLDRPA